MIKHGWKNVMTQNSPIAPSLRLRPVWVRFQEEDFCLYE